ncbi:MAG: carbohydrate kinase family protein [Candidatus Nealsonbacteria bacterium]|nr:MAG: carbohydrate kinase family protein [Candidatus Nealsonbacteria bacterium]
MNKLDIVVLGHILNEKIIFSDDKEIYPVLGSPVAYSSACMASLGVRTGIVTKIGEDFPKKLLKIFQQLSINQEGIKMGEKSTNNELIYDKEGNKTVKFITKAEDIFFEDIPSSYLNTKIFYICPMDYEIDIKTIKKIYGLGKIMAVDIGGYGGGTSDTHPKEKSGYEIKELCPFFDIVKGSIEDYYHIFGVGVGDEKEVSRKMIQWGAKISVITLGKEGSYIKTKDAEYYIPAFPTPIEEILDRTGAGDCFSAGFLTHFLHNRDPYASAVYASATTSYVIEQSGGVVVERMPKKKEIERRIKIINNIAKD